MVGYYCWYYFRNSTVWIRFVIFVAEILSLVSEFPEELDNFSVDQNGTSATGNDTSSKSQQLSQLLSSSTPSSSQAGSSVVFSQNIIGSSLSSLTPNQQLYSTNNSTGRTVIPASNVTSVTHGIHPSNVPYSNVVTTNLSAGNVSATQGFSQRPPNLQQHVGQMNGPQLTSQPRPTNLSSVLTSFNQAGQNLNTLTAANMSQVSLPNHGLSALPPGLNQLTGHTPQFARVRIIFNTNFLGLNKWSLVKVRYYISSLKFLRLVNRLEKVERPMLNWKSGNWFNNSWCFCFMPTNVNDVNRRTERTSLVLFRTVAPWSKFYPTCRVAILERIARVSPIDFQNLRCASSVNVDVRYSFPLCFFATNHCSLEKLYTARLCSVPSLEKCIG